MQVYVFLGSIVSSVLIYGVVCCAYLCALRCALRCDVRNCAF
jgi:hypothetical protein